MAGLIWLLIGAAVAVFLTAVWLVGHTARRRRAAFTELADGRGWDYQATAPADLVGMAARFPLGAVEGRDYLAGPTPAGPFRMCVLRPQSSESTRAAMTLLHLRTSVASPGLEVSPSGRFRLFRKGADEVARPDHEGFRRRYHVATNDAAFAEAALDWEACALLLRPRQGVSLSWQGHDLVLVFPLITAPPRGAETLLAYGAALARRLEPHAEPLPRAAQRPPERSRAPAPTFS